MTANTGKGADDKRPTGADAESGRTRKKTSAAKPHNDEVTVRTDDTNGAAPRDDSDDTVIDVPIAADEDGAVRDTTPSAGDDDATVVDAAPMALSPSSSSSPSSDDESGRTGTFRLPEDRESGSEDPDFDTAGHEAAEPTAHDDVMRFPQESGDSMLDSGRSAAMDTPTSPSGRYGSVARGAAASRSTSSSGTSAFAGGSPPYAPDGPGRPGDSGRPGRPGAAELTSRVAKLAGALRKPDTRLAGRKAPRKAHLQVARFDPWSVMKFSFIMSLVSFLVLFVAVAVLYVILSWLGVFDALSNTIHDLTSNDQGKSGSLNPAGWFSAARILGYTALIGTLNVLLITALATVWSVIYNMAADLVGGVEVTLKEADQ
jgi:Transmembrane domain of unknown function (DUF3566)